MSIKKCNNKWLVDIQPQGRGGKRYRKTLATKGEALQYQAWITEKTRTLPKWSKPKNDNRKLSDLITQWYKVHGKQLKFANGRYQTLMKTCKALNNPPAQKLTANNFIHYRNKRLENGITANTTNHELAYLKAVFNELVRLNEWPHENPLAKVRPLKITERELNFLSVEQIAKLLEELGKSKNYDALLVTKVCLATGARWGEVENLQCEQVEPKHGRITFTKTKNGKNRTVPIDTNLCKEILQQCKTNGKLFNKCYATFRHAIKQCKIKLPNGQSSHVLRHTFASHFIINGGNIAVLQKVLGHSNINITMRYAHLAPEHLESVKILNPLYLLTLC